MYTTLLFKSSCVSCTYFVSESVSRQGFISSLFAFMLTQVALSFRSFSREINILKHEEEHKDSRKRLKSDTTDCQTKRQGDNPDSWTKFLLKIVLFSRHHFFHLSEKGIEQKKYLSSFA